MERRCQPVKIEFSADQFRALVELAYLGSWMVNGIRAPAEQVERYSQVEQYLFSLADRFGLRDVTEMYEPLGAWVPTHAFEERMAERIAEYDNQTFWDELVERLADRDVFVEYGEAFRALPVEQQIAKREPVVERYEREFETHGLDRVRIPEF